MSDQVGDIWRRFDNIITKTSSPEAKAMVEAIKLQTELLNLRLAPLEHYLGALIHQDAERDKERIGVLLK